MVQYYFNHKTKETIAVLSNCKYDAVNQIYKMVNPNIFYINSDRYLMANQYKATVKCYPDDEYDVEVGMKLAKAKLMEKYYNALDKRIEMFKNDVGILADNVFQPFEDSWYV